MRKFLFLTLLVISSLLQAEEWTGTGWALKGGYIVTNFHCVDGASSIIVRGNYDYNAEVVAVDQTIDLAIIKITTLYRNTECFRHHTLVSSLPFYQVCHAKAF